MVSFWTSSAEVFSLIFMFTVSVSLPINFPADSTCPMPDSATPPERPSKWQNTVPYEISPDFPNEERANITAYLQEIALLTGKCIKFVERSTQPDYIYFYRDTNCGGAFVGRQPKGQEQRVKMAANCLQKKGMFMHALLHTLGIFHENSRMDRDAYVSVMCGNVQKEFFPDYNKRTEMDSYGLPYDYDSVMHLGIEDFAIDSKVPTMTAMDDDVDLTRLGQRDGLSVLDARKLRVAYGCEVRPA